MLFRLAPFFVCIFLFINCRAIERTFDDIKVLVLIIASDDLPVYLKEQKIWRSYMHYNPKHIEAYFIKGNPHLSNNYEIKGDTIWSKTEESLNPGILNKTVSSLEAMLPRMHEFDYVVRTNLSSFYVFPQLLNFLKTLPRNKCYSGPCHYIWNDQFMFAGGYGFILSRDVAQLFVQEKKALLEQGKMLGVNDDVAIGAFLKNENIHLIAHNRTILSSIAEFNNYKDFFSDKKFLFRLKNDVSKLRATDEVYIQKQMFKKFYPQLFKAMIH